MQLYIRPNGSLVGRYGEALDLSTLGQLNIRRASQVEPDSNGCWHADLSPVGGPRLGPFARRSEALAAEVSWLEAYHLQQL